MYNLLSTKLPNVVEPADAAALGAAEKALPKFGGGPDSSTND